jgi:PASTA domain
VIHGFGLWRRGALLGVLACLAAVGLAIPATAAARTVTVGQLFTPRYACTRLLTYLVTGVASGTSYTVPKPGVITSWSFGDGATAVAELKLKVGRSAASGRYTIVAQAAAGKQITKSVNTYSAHIPVRAGDLIGLVQDGGNCATDTFTPTDSAVFAGGDVSPGTTTAFSPFTEFKFPISVKVALDCAVPNLKGKALKAAKKALKTASCTLGKVTPKGQTKGKVKSQNPAAGKTLAPGAKVNIRLG